MNLNYPDEDDKASLDIWHLRYTEYMFRYEVESGKYLDLSSVCAVS